MLGKMKRLCPTNRQRMSTVRQKSMDRMRNPRRGLGLQALPSTIFMQCCRRPLQSALTRGANGDRFRGVLALSTLPLCWKWGCPWYHTCSSQRVYKQSVHVSPKTIRPSPVHASMLQQSCPLVFWDIEDWKSPSTWCYVLCVNRDSSSSDIYAGMKICMCACACACFFFPMIFRIYITSRSLCANRDASLQIWRHKNNNLYMCTCAFMIFNMQVLVHKSRCLSSDMHA